MRATDSPGAAARRKFTSSVLAFTAARQRDWRPLSSLPTLSSAPVHTGRLAALYSARQSARRPPRLTPPTPSCRYAPAEISSVLPPREELLSFTPIQPTDTIFLEATSDGRLKTSGAPGSVCRPDPGRLAAA